MIKKINNKGITLIALVITIIIMLILAVISINFLFGENSIIERAKEANFKAKFSQVKEEVQIYYAGKKTYEINSAPIVDLLPVSNKVSNSDIDGFKNSLKKEIQELSAKEDITLLNLYYIDKTKVQTKDDYIIDIDTFQLYHIKGAKYFGKMHHTMEGSGYEDVPEEETIIKDTPLIREQGDIGWYAPNMQGFSEEFTYMIYYNESDTSDIKTIPVKEYIENGKQNKIIEDEKTYYLDAYDKKMWANVKTIANGLECWWVWIPRYAYKVNSDDKQIEIIYVETDNSPIGEISEYDKINGTTTSNFAEEYTIHPSFTVEGKELQGIWVAKYEASNNTTHEMSSDLAYAPDMTGFDPKYTYIELFNSESNTFDDEKMLAEANLNTINNDSKWYDYSKKQWANIKTNANNLECWWVWIPRYAYYISEGNQEVDIIFIDTNNKPMDKQRYGNTLPEQFTVHPSFDVEGKKLKGIWVAKYEASNNTTHEMSSDLAFAPNMSGFDPNYTYIELYDAETGTFTDVNLSEANLSTINNDNTWYNYSKKQWANIKTNANGLECWWVWIPRYAYKISEGNQEVDIIFINTEDKPYDSEMYGDILPEGFIVHPSFNVEGQKLQGIWVAKYEASVVADVTGGTIPTGSSTLEYADDTAGNNHTHVANGAGTKERYVTSSTKWCTAYDGTPCNNYGYNIYCSLCGVRLRHYWCKNHYNPSTKVIIDDSNVE